MERKEGEKRSEGKIANTSHKKSLTRVREKADLRANVRPNPLIEMQGRICIKEGRKRRGKNLREQKSNDARTSTQYISDKASRKTPVTSISYLFFS